MVTWLWRSRLITSIFNVSREYPRMHVWCKFGDFSQIFYNCESKWPKWHWRLRSMTPIFNIDQEYPMMHIWCKFSNSSSNSLKVSMQKSHIFKNSKSKWPKWLWRSRSMTSIFDSFHEYPMMHVWCKFSDSSSNLWRVIVWTRSSLQTYGHMDRCI